MITSKAKHRTSKTWHMWHPSNIQKQINPSWISAGGMNWMFFHFSLYTLSLALTGSSLVLHPCEPQIVIFWVWRTGRQESNGFWTITVVKWHIAEAWTDWRRTISARIGRYNTFNYVGRVPSFDEDCLSEWFLTTYSSTLTKMLRRYIWYAYFDSIECKASRNYMSVPRLETSLESLKYSVEGPERILNFWKMFCICLLLCFLWQEWFAEREPHKIEPNQLKNAKVAMSTIFAWSLLLDQHQKCFRMN